MIQPQGSAAAAFWGMSSMVWNHRGLGSWARTRPQRCRVATAGWRIRLRSWNGRAGARPYRVHFSGCKKLLHY